MTRRLRRTEIAEMLASDSVARLATIDGDGYPHITPLWFLYWEGTFFLASDVGRSHLARIGTNPKVGLVIDTEEQERPDGERPNRQIRVTGDATVGPDAEGSWTKRIWAKYSSILADGETAAARLQGRQRQVIRVRPQDFVAVASQ